MESVRLSLLRRTLPLNFPTFRGDGGGLVGIRLLRSGLLFNPRLFCLAYPTHRSRERDGRLEVSLRPRPNLPKKTVEPVEVFLDDAADLVQVQRAVLVHDPISELNELYQTRRQLRGKPSAPAQEQEKILARLGFAQELTGDEVGGCIHGYLDRDLEGMEEEALIPEILFDPFRPT